MSSRSVQIIGGRNREWCFVEDAPRNALRVVDADTIEFGLESGKTFIAAFTEVALAAGGTSEILLQTGASLVHMTLLVSVSAAFRGFLFEDATFSAEGDAVPNIARDRTDILTPSLTITSAPTLIADGNSLGNTFFPGGRGAQAIGSFMAGTGDWFLKPNSVYLIRLLNLSNTTSSHTLGVQTIDEGAA